MENFNLEAGPKTPFVSLDPRGTIELRGKSIPENATEFYKPIWEWIDAYAKNPGADTNVILQLEYFNTSSSKCILDVLRRVENIHQSQKSVVTVHWLFEEDDEDMQETGEDYSSIVKVPFKITAQSS
jgi:hypothetical protein